MGGGDCIIEDFSMISQGCRLVTCTDDFINGGFGTPTTPNGIKYRNLLHGKINIGRFCIIGANSVILPNSLIAEGATVGAGSVVASDKTLNAWGVYINSRRVAERNKDGVLENYNNWKKEYENGK